MRRVIAVILISVMMISTTSCSKEQKKYKASFLKLFDTVTEIAAYADTEKDFREFAQLVYDNLEEYHQLYDIYNNYDGINNMKTINDNAGITPVKVDQRIIKLLLFSKEMNQLTKGKVNVAMGSLLAIWHSYREAGINNPLHAQLPMKEELEKANQHTDINDVVINEAKSTVYLADKKMSLDVGAIAKGYATEMVAQIIIQKGYQNFLLSVGGNVRAVGSKPMNKSPWNVGIQNPDVNSEQNCLYTMDLIDLSLVSSGSYERYYTVDGKQYHHIIDPQILAPSDYYTQVTILCKDSGLADALSTAVFLLPYEDGKALIESIEGVSAMWVFADGEKKFSENFKRYIKKE